MQLHRPGLAWHGLQPSSDPTEDNVVRYICTDKAAELTRLMFKTRIRIALVARLACITEIN